MADAPAIERGAGGDREAMAWAAGFFDGEGSTRVQEDRRPGRTMPTLVLSVGQLRKEPLVRFQEAVLGLGRIYGPYQEWSRKNPIYRWQTTNWRDGQAVLAMLWGFLSLPKREQGSAALLRLRAVPGWQTSWVSPQARRAARLEYCRQYYRANKWKWNVRND